jgi:hypothetical protein
MSLTDDWKNGRSAGQRIATAIPVCIEWKTIAGDIRRARGITRDISNIGICAHMRHPLAVGLWVQFELAFPTELTGSRPWKFYCRGPVVRSEKVGNEFVIAVSIRTRQLIDNPKLHRRSNFRVVPSSLLTAEYLKTQAIVREITCAGAFLEVSDPLPVGQEMELLLCGPELAAEVRVRAAVRNVKPSVGMGVEFIALSADADRVLRQLTERHSRAA